MEIVLETTPIRDPIQEKTLAYKQKLLSERAARNAEEQAVKSAVIQQKDAEKCTLQDREARGEEWLRTIAFQRLYRLNTENLDRLESILSCTNRSIRYADVQALIGQGEHQLRGSIENAKGSHRKIILDAVPDAPDFLGYFDEPAPETVKDQDSQTPVLFSPDARNTVTGGLYEPHGTAHSPKITPVIKKMLSNIFEKAGITEERLTLFKESKARCAAEGIEQPSMAELSQAAVMLNAQDQREHRFPVRS